MPKTSENRILDTMIELSRCSRDDRIILAGAASSGRIVDWQRRGYRRVATTATCRLPDARYGVACIEWRHRSIKALEATLDWLVHFLSANAVLVIWTDAAISTAPGRRELRGALERFGFAVDTGTRCENGFAISARRRAAADNNHGEAVRQTVAA